MRWIASVSVSPDQTIHYEGPPPGIIEGLDRVQMPDARWVVLETNKDGAFLIRYGENGDFAGDTWSPSREIALAVAAEEFGLQEEDWVEVPADVADPIAFVRTAARTRVQ